jgi:hypothetical protein
MQQLVRPLLWLYPDYWRARYGEEFAAVLEAHPLRLTTVLDVLLGALDAHISPQDTTGRIMQAINRPRRSAIAIFCAYIAFVLAGLNYFKATEDDIRRLMHGHADISAAYLVLQAAAGMALLAVVAGGLPVGLAALRRACEQKRWDIPLLLAVPLVALAVWLGWTVFLALAVFRATTRAGVSGLDGLLFLSWGGLFVLAAIVSTASVSIAVSRSGLEPRVFRRALWPAAVVTALMAVMLGAVLFWGLAVRMDVPSYFNTPTTPFRFAYWIAWVTDVAVMAVATLVAAVALVRGFSGPRDPQAASIMAGAA